MRLPRFNYLEPESVAEALTLLANHQDAVIKAGGTDLIPRLKRRLVEPKSLINLSGLSDLDFIRKNTRGGLHIGALTPLQKIESSPLVQERFGALANAVAKIASIEVRNVGTLGGNICLDTRCEFYNQSPLFRSGADPCIKAGGSKCYVSRKGNRCHGLFCADAVPLLMVSEAKLKIISASDERRIPIQDFYTGDGKVPFSLLRNQIVAEIEIPEAVREARAAYLKFRFREGMDFPVVGVAVSRPNGQDEDEPRGIRIGVGGATSRPFRCLKAEAILKTEKIDSKVLEKAGDTAVEEMQMTSHSGCPVSYRRTLVKQLMIRGVQMVLD